MNENELMNIKEQIEKCMTYVTPFGSPTKLSTRSKRIDEEDQSKNKIKHKSHQMKLAHKLSSMF